MPEPEIICVGGAKFDLNALPDGHTVSYFISDQGPGPVMAGDSYQAIVSQIRLAAAAWNGVASSDLRLAFGGIASTATQQLSPGIDVVFDDNMPPGLLAQSLPTYRYNIEAKIDALRESPPGGRLWCGGTL